MKHILLLALTVALALLLGGCATLEEDGGRDFEPTWPEEAEAPKATPGAIYAQGTDVVAVAERHRAQCRRHAHDPARREHRAPRRAPTHHGQQVDDGDAHRARRRSAGRSPSMACRFSKARWTTNPDFAGNGASKQSNELDGDISVTVAKRFPNGNLLVRGQKWIAINTGREFVRVQGIVRPTRHRAGQLAWSRGRSPTPTSPMAGRARWRMPTSRAGCTASSIHRTRLSER